MSLDQFTAVDQKERECKEHIWMLGKLFGKQVSVDGDSGQNKPGHMLVPKQGYTRSTRTAEYNHTWRPQW